LLIGAVRVARRDARGPPTTRQLARNEYSPAAPVNPVFAVARCRPGLLVAISSIWSISTASRISPAKEKVA
jgi:hypothetical protein